MLGRSPPSPCYQLLRNRSRAFDPVGPNGIIPGFIHRRIFTASASTPDLYQPINVHLPPFCARSRTARKVPTLVGRGPELPVNVGQLLETPSIAGNDSNVGEARLFSRCSALRPQSNIDSAPTPAIDLESAGLLDEIAELSEPVGTRVEVRVENG